jgi:hypothetical protein
MGQGSYTICEWDSIKKEYPDWQRTLAELEARVIAKCDKDWAPKTFGGLTPSSEQYGRTTILPALFDDHNGVQMVHWRQFLTAAGHQTLITGMGAGHVLPKNFKVAWMGLMLPNKQQHLTEIRMQISDGKYGRINLEEIHSYNKPAIVFEEGFLLNEKAGFELYGYVEGPIPRDHEGRLGFYQSIIMLGSAYYEVIDRVLGPPGAAITEE